VVPSSLEWTNGEVRVLGIGLRPGKLSGGEIWRWFEKLSGLVLWCCSTSAWRVTLRQRDGLRKHVGGHWQDNNGQHRGEER
jgi:hypothetical protein